MKKHYGVAVLALAAFLLSSSSSRGQTPKDKERIVGKWETTRKEGEIEAKITLDFRKDGTLKMSLSAKVGGNDKMDVSVDGTYKWVDKDHIESNSRC